jgi:hypothetical protein
MSIIRRFDESLGGIVDPLNTAGGENTTASGDINAILSGNFLDPTGTSGDSDGFDYDPPDPTSAIPWKQIGLFLLVLVAINAFAGGIGEGLTG